MIKGGKYEAEKGLRFVNDGFTLYGFRFRKHAGVKQIE